MFGVDYLGGFTSDFYTVFCVRCAGIHYSLLQLKIGSLMTIVDEIITVIAVQRPHASSQKKHKHTIYIMSFVLLSYAGLPFHIGDFLAGNKVHLLPHLRRRPRITP